MAVVVSIDPRRVYIKTPNDVPFKSVKVTNLGPNGEAYAWYQCTVTSFAIWLWSIPNAKSKRKNCF
ncbi:Imidazole glycerol phosphate synthase hisHF chloroplastic [Bienertia sinuspersici]